MKTYEKGRIGVAKAIADLTVKGYDVAAPLSEHAPFDLVIAKDGKFLGVQVKYREKKPNGVVTVSLRSSWSNSSGCHTKASTKEYVDIVCVYCPDTDECYYINPQSFHQAILLRVEGVGDKQSHYAKDFKDITW